MPLLTSRRLGPLLVTQALGAVNDNLFKNALVVLVLFKAAAAAGPAMVAAAGGVFILPYVLLSATAGQLADRYEKSRTIRIVKLAEVALMAVAAAGFLLNSMPVLFAVLFGLGVQATFFSPLKYGILPSHLAEDELVAGNGLVEAGTFLGILAGTIAGSALFSLPGGPVIVSGAGLAIAAAGVGSAMLIPQAASRAPGLRIGWNLVRETGGLLRVARANRPVWLSLLGLSWFWVLGATVLAQLPTLVRDDLGADPAVFTVMLAFFSVGVGGGSLLCSRLLRGEVSARLVPLAALGLSVFIWDFGHAARHGHGLASVAVMLHSLGGWRMLADLLLLAGCGGLYSVPLYAIIQERSAPTHLARMVAANNVVNAVGIVVAAVVTALLSLAGAGAVSILLLTAVANLAVAGWIMRLVPQQSLLAGFRGWFRMFHAVEIAGLANLPPAGQGAVVVVNRSSFKGLCFVAAYLPGAPVFAVDVDTARRWWEQPFLAAIPTLATDSANPVSAQAAVRAVRAGQALVMFSVERATAAFPAQRVYDCAAMVAGQAGALLIPVRLGQGVATPRRGWGWRLFPPLSLTVLSPLAFEVDPALCGRARRRMVGLALERALQPPAAGAVAYAAA